MTQFRSIKVDGIFCKISTTGKSAVITVTKWDAFEELEKVLMKTPRGDFPEGSRIFGIGNRGVFEIYDDDEVCPEDYISPEVLAKEDDVPF